ncbi:MAG TPA: ABC transporter ATP-binding protein [Alphaproteobacteria bacterium]|nr:ABC transporter ATP-binding protein [Alphaproteobacteria bacterium]
MQDIREPLLTLRGVTKLYDRFRAVDDISLDIRRGEFFSLLGPSGCGKSTTLRIIAGLEQPEHGDITLNKVTLVNAESGVFLPSQKRNMGMVFQSYAIWPHLSVFDTVAYPLAVRKMPKDQINTKVREMLHLVGLEGYENRMAPMLSGGQQQRVALARALVYEPHVLLLDEPFSNLDVKLREQMRIELKLLQRRVGVTVILVTHDQLEALSLSDRIAVMNAGHVEQLGSPADLYENPRTAFVRDFIGASLQLRGKLLGRAPEGATIELDGAGRLEGRLHDGAALRDGGEITATIRPESLIVGPADGAAQPNSIEATVQALLFVGDKYECVLKVGGQDVRSFLPRARGRAAYEEGSRIRLTFPASEVTIWPR